VRARLRPGTWRAIHWLAYGTWPIALAHTFGMGTDAGEGWVILLGVACAVAVAVALVWRVRTASRQASMRAAHASLAETPPKHLTLTAGPARAGRGARRV